MRTVFFSALTTGAFCAGFATIIEYAIDKDYFKAINCPKYWRLVIVKHASRRRISRNQIIGPCVFSILVAPIG